MSPASGPGGGPATIRALQAALTAENTAVYGYGVAGAHLTGARRACRAPALGGQTVSVMVTRTAGRLLAE